MDIRWIEWLDRLWKVDESYIFAGDALRDGPKDGNYIEVGKVLC